MMDIPTIVVKPCEGRAVWLGGMGIVFKVSGADTGGTFAVVEHPIEPGRLVLPHVHSREDEYSYVLEGTIGARVGDREVIAGPGSYLIKPRGLMHTFWNAGPGPARLLEVISPAGFEAYFAELAEAGDPGRRVPDKPQAAGGHRGTRQDTRLVLDEARSVAEEPSFSVPCVTRSSPATSRR